MEFFLVDRVWKEKDRAKDCQGRTLGRKKIDFAIERMWQLGKSSQKEKSKLTNEIASAGGW